MQTINTPFAGFTPFQGINAFPGAFNPFVPNVGAPIQNLTQPNPFGFTTPFSTPFQNTFNTPISALTPQTLLSIANQPYALSAASTTPFNFNTPWNAFAQPISSGFGTPMNSVYSTPFNTVPQQINPSFGGLYNTTPWQGLPSPSNISTPFNTPFGMTPYNFGAPNIFNTNPLSQFGFNPSFTNPNAFWNGVQPTPPQTPFSSSFNTTPYSYNQQFQGQPFGVPYNTSVQWPTPGVFNTPNAYSQPLWNGFNPIQPGFIPSPVFFQPVNQPQNVQQPGNVTAGKIGENPQHAQSGQPTAFQPVYAYNPGFFPGGLTPQGYANPFIGFAPVNGGPVPQQVQRDAA